MSLGGIAKNTIGLASETLSFAEKPFNMFASIGEWMKAHHDGMHDVTQLSDFINPQKMTKTLIFVMIAFSFSTAIGSWGGFSNPPQIFKKAVQFWYVRYFLLFVLIWQGGGDGNLYVSAFGTILFALIEFLIKRYDDSIQRFFGFDPEEKV